MLENVTAVSLGSRIKAAREQAGKTQPEAGDVLGVSAQQIGKYESGKSTINAVQLAQLARAFRRRIAYFFDTDDT